MRSRSNARCTVVPLGPDCNGPGPRLLDALVTRDTLCARTLALVYVGQVWQRAAQVVTAMGEQIPDVSIPIADYLSFITPASLIAYHSTHQYGKYEVRTTARQVISGHLHVHVHVHVHLYGGVIKPKEFARNYYGTAGSAPLQNANLVRITSHPRNTAWKDGRMCFLEGELSRHTDKPISGDSGIIATATAAWTDRLRTYHLRIPSILSLPSSSLA